MKKQSVSNQTLLNQFQTEGLEFYSKNSMINYLADVHHFVHYLEKESLLTQTTQTLGDYLTHLVELTDETGKATYKQSTVNRHRASLVAFYNFITTKGLLEQNPATDLKSVSVHKRGKEVEIDYLERHEMKQLLEEIKNPKYQTGGLFNLFNQQRDLVLYHLMMTTGLRINEVSALTFDQIDLETRLIQVVDKEGEARQVPYPKGLDQEIEDYLDLRTQIGIELENRLFFVTKTGTAITIQNSNAALRKYSTGMGLGRKISNGDLRHTYAINMIRVGVPLEQLSYYLGNKTTYFTSVLYQDFLNPTAQTVVEQIDL